MNFVTYIVVDLLLPSNKIAPLPVFAPRQFAAILLASRDSALQSMFRHPTSCSSEPLVLFQGPTLSSAINQKHISNFQSTSQPPFKKPGFWDSTLGQNVPQPRHIWRTAINQKCMWIFLTSGLWTRRQRWWTNILLLSLTNNHWLPLQSYSFSARLPNPNAVYPGPSIDRSPRPIHPRSIHSSDLSTRNQILRSAKYSRDVVLFDRSRASSDHGLLRESARIAGSGWCPPQAGLVYRLLQWGRQ